MSFCRSASSHRLGPYHAKTPKHQFANYPLRKTKAKDFELANYEILLDQVNAALALPCTPSELEIRENFKKDLLDFIAEREAEILAEHLAEKVAKCQLHRVSAKARIKTTAKAPKQTPKTTAKVPEQTPKTTEVPKQEGNIVLET